MSVTHPQRHLRPGDVIVAFDGDQRGHACVLETSRSKGSNMLHENAYERLHAAFDGAAHTEPAVQVWNSHTQYAVCGCDNPDYTMCQDGDGVAWVRVLVALYGGDSE